MIYPPLLAPNSNFHDPPASSRPWKILYDFIYQSEYNIPLHPPPQGCEHRYENTNRNQIRVLDESTSHLD